MENKMEESRGKWLTKTYIVCLLAMLCCILWGSAFPCIKLGYRWWKIASEDTGAQLLFAGFRFILAGIFTIMIGSVLQRKFLYPGKKSWKSVIKLSIFQTILQYFFFYMGLANTTGVKASIITAMNVFLAIFVAAFWFHQEKLQSGKVIGCILGFIGVIIVNCNSGGFDFSMKWNGEGAVFLSAFSSAVSSALIKLYSKDNNPVMLSGYQFVAGGAALAVIGRLLGGRLEYVSVSGILILLYLALVSAVAYTVWGILLTYNPVSKVAVFGFINPVAGVFLSALILEEKSVVSGFTIGALLFVSIGIYIVNKRQKE